MKRLRQLLLATILILTSFIGFSQGRTGIKGGANFSTLYTQNVQDKNVKISGTFGLYTKQPLLPNLYIQPELIYSGKGSQVHYNSLLGNSEYRFNLHYLEVPVALVAQVSPNFSIHGGGYASYLLNANIRKIRNWEDHDLNEDDFNRFDVGVLGGISFDGGGISIGARYDYGLKNIGKTEQLKNSKNSTVSLFLNIPLE